MPGTMRSRRVARTAISSRSAVTSLSSTSAHGEHTGVERNRIGPASGCSSIHGSGASGCRGHPVPASGPTRGLEPVLARIAERHQLRAARTTSSGLRSMGRHAARCSRRSARSGTTGPHRWSRREIFTWPEALSYATALSVARTNLTPQRPGVRPRRFDQAEPSNASDDRQLGAWRADRCARAARMRGQQTTCRQTFNAARSCSVHSADACSRARSRLSLGTRSRSRSSLGPTRQRDDGALAAREHLV